MTGFCGRAPIGESALARDNLPLVMSPRPLVSICCSTHSRPDLFEQSLKSFLRQTYEPLEIVVLVDGANPASIEILEKNADPRLRWFTTPTPSGMIPAWNKVVGPSTGTYFLFCADDDVLLDHAVDAQVWMLDENPRVGFTHADFHFIDDDGNRIGEWQSHEGTWIKPGLREWERYLTQPKCCMQTAVVRKSLWDQVGGWDEDAGYPGDNSLYLKLLRIADVGHVARFTCDYRVRTKSPDSWLKNSNKVKEDIALARKHLANPPPELQGRLDKLRESVERHFARNAFAVLADTRGTPEQRAEFAKWAEDNLFRHGLWGTINRWIVRHGLERIPATTVRLDHRARAFARTIVTSARRVLIPARETSP
jgi:glycosyltransferase involved in cell wall biosynthesis